jgi:hypothetical protein
MERKVVVSAVITLIAGGLLAAGNPAFSLEGDASISEKTVAGQEKAGIKENSTDKPDKAGQAALNASEAKVDEEKKPAGDTVSISLKMPFFSHLFTDVPLASVGDQVITVQELRNAVASVHEKMTMEKETQAKKSFMDILDRLVNVKLVNQEARNIELDKLPEIRKEMDNNAEMQLRQELFVDHVKDLKPDEKEVERLYREMIREWKLNSVLFKKDADAKAFENEIKSGKGFDELRAKAIKEGKAEQAGQNEENYANAASLGPVLATAIANLKAGSVSPIVSLQNQFIIVKVLDDRSVENTEAREKARAQVLSKMKLESLKKYKDDLYKKYVKQEIKVIKSLDFEAAKPGLKALVKDKRTIVTVKGEKPITVSELAEAIRDKYYHGVETAIKEKRVNREKLPILDELISKRVFRRAALEKGLDKTKDYKLKLAQFEESLIFGTFIEKVVKPDITITQDEIKAYYEDHKSGYVYPQMLQIEDIVFKNKDDAQTSIDKLRKGMDFKWLKNNAEGQVAKDAKGVVEFGGQMLSVRSFPEDLQKVLNGAREGDYRLYQSPEGYSYVLLISKEAPARTQTLEEVKSDVAEKVRWQNFGKAVDEWFKKLREAYPVTIYLQQQ